MKKQKPRQQGHISILNRVYVLQIHEKAALKRTHKNKELVAFMLLILPDVTRHFKDPRMCKSNVNHKKLQKPKI